MLFDAYKTYPYTADHYRYNVISNPNDPDQTSLQYVSVPVKIKVAISTSFIGDLVIITKTKLQKSARISNLIDKNGNEIYPGAVWQISQTMPRTNPIGFVEGYKYKAKLISGDV